MGLTSRTSWQNAEKFAHGERACPISSQPRSFPVEEPADEDELDPLALLAEVRRGSADALARLVEHYRPYLATLARLHGNRRFQQKFDDSDLVQETLVIVQRDLGGFRGATEAELTAWLRRIMASVSGKHVRHFSRQRRNALLEQRIEDEFSQSSQRMGQALIAAGTSPSEKIHHRERAVILSQALAELPADYREALILNRLEGLTMAQTARRMGRSPDSVQKLLGRGLLELRRRLEGRL
jgi:RNA polymerase sigma-70 factor (subfamily 1)